MRKLFFSMLLLAVASAGKAQVLGVRTNIPVWGFYGTINAGLEAGFARKWSVSVDGAYNPFTWGDKKKTELLAVQGELRFWPRYKFAGHFIGLHGHYGQYDWGLKKYRYKGNLYGAGVSYGYSYLLSARWCLEGNLGFGYTRLQHEYRYDRLDDRSYFPPNPKNCWGITRIGISIIYLIK